MCEVKSLNELAVNPEAVLEAANKAYNANCNPARWLLNWNWRFNSGSYEKALAFYIQENADIASFVAVSPLQLIGPQAKKLKAGLAIMGLTHPDYQGKGYYSRVYRYMEEKVKKLGYDCLIAFDNHNSHYPEVKYLNWRDIGLLTNFSLNWKEYSRLGVRNPSYHVTTDIVQDRILDVISEYHTNQSPYSFQRDLRFLRWRFLEHPLKRYHVKTLKCGSEILACVVYKYYQEDAIDIMEVFYKDIDSTLNLLRLHHILEDIVEKENRNINIWSNLSTDEHLYLEKIGFEERCFSAYFVCNPLGMDESILDKNNWHYRYMDSDVY